VLYDHLNDVSFSGQLIRLPVIPNRRLTTTWGKVNFVTSMSSRLIPTNIDVGVKPLLAYGPRRMIPNSRVTALEWLMLHEMTHVMLWQAHADYDHTQLFNMIMSNLTGCVMDHRYTPR
jgi:hypothetical protein